MSYQLTRKSNGFSALAEMMLHLNKHPATNRLQIKQVVPILNGAINRGHYRFFHDGNACVGFGAWALASRKAAHRWAFDEDGSDVGDGKSGDGAILSFLICNDLNVTRYAQSASREVFTGLNFLCGRRTYASGRTRPVWIELQK